MKRRLVSVCTAALGAALLLGGCSNAAGIKALDRAATAEDALPSGFSAEPTQPDTARLLTTHDGAKYFVAKGKDAGTACVAVVAEAKPASSVLGCGLFSSSQEIVTSSGQDRKETKLVRDGFDSKKLESEGWTRIHENLLVKEK